MYWERYIDRRNPRRIEPLDKPIDTYIMLDTETTGLNPEEGATLIEIGALFVQPPTRSRSRCSTKRFVLRPPGEGSGMKGKTDIIQRKKEG